MVKTVFKIIALVLLVGYLLAAGFIYGFWREEPLYRDIKVDITYPNDDAHFLTEQNILQLVSSKPGFKCKGQGYNAINTLELSQYITEHNLLVRHAVCYHTPDSLLRIDVEQRDPILRIKSDRAIKDALGHSLQDFYVDRDGEMMPAQFGTAIALPLVTGAVRSAQIPSLHEFALFLRGDDFWGNEVTQIYVRDNGDIELIPRVGDHTILLGSLDDYEVKLDRVLEFYHKALPQKGWNAYRVINAKFNGQIVGEK